MYHHDDVHYCDDCVHFNHDDGVLSVIRDGHDERYDRVLFVDDALNVFLNRECPRVDVAYCGVHHDDGQSSHAMNENLCSVLRVFS